MYDLLQHHVYEHVIALCVYLQCRCEMCLLCTGCVGACGGQVFAERDRVCVCVGVSVGANSSL